VILVFDSTLLDIAHSGSPQNAIEHVFGGLIDFGGNQGRGTPLMAIRTEDATALGRLKSAR
jgi:hypothetical protein